MEQFKALLNVIPSITAAISTHGEDIDVPDISIPAGDKNDKVAASTSKKSKSKPGKSNIEATSDEDEE